MHGLDLSRAQEWKQETVLVCDESWKKYVSVDQPVLFIDRNRLFQKQSSQGVDYLDQFLEQLDHFEIKKVTQIGELSWGRWISAYFEKDVDISFKKIEWEGSFLSSLELLNAIGDEFGLDLNAPVQTSAKSSAVYVDPYIGGELSPLFVKMARNTGAFSIPSWVRILCNESDVDQLSALGLSDHLVDNGETESQLFNQSILCFSDDSLFAQTSRSYNVALINVDSEQSLFLPGDLSICFQEDLHFSELINILSYWKMKRLKELAFQWLNMGVEIEYVESFHSRVMKRNLLNYSTDLFHIQFLTREFLANPGDLSRTTYFEIIHCLRKKVSNDPYTLSFSLKILLNIVERMVSSAECGERLFERLGSDYHRIIIGESLIEGLIEMAHGKNGIVDVKMKLKAFHQFLMQVDHFNDQTDKKIYFKESA